MSLDNEDRSHFSGADRERSAQEKHFFITLVTLSALGVVIACLLRWFFPSVEVSAVVLGTLIACANLLAWRLVVKDLVGARSEGCARVSPLRPLVVLALKLPILLIVLIWVSRQSLAFIVSCLCGFLIFIPTSFIVAFRPRGAGVDDGGGAGRASAP